MDALIRSWNSVDWEKIQARIDEEIHAIEAREQGAEAGKKRLLEESAKYRENTTKDIRQVAVPLIKAFQREVDGLNARSQVAETALIGICSQLTNLPDPRSVLQQAVAWKLEAERAKKGIEEAEALRQTVTDLHAEFADLKNQDVTIRQLREQIKQLEERNSEAIDETIGDTEKRLREEFSIREIEMNMRSEKLRAENGNMERKISELEATNRDVQRRLDAARMNSDRKEAFVHEQVDILTRDLNDARKRIANFEAEVAGLTSELVEARSQQQRGSLEDIAALGGLMIEKDEEIRRLHDEIKRLKEAERNEIAELRGNLQEGAMRIQQQEELISQLKEQLSDKSDYEAIKNELRLLREIEFGEAASANEESIQKLGETVQTLDRLLAEKNRRLQNENAHLRMENAKQKAGQSSAVVEKVSSRVGQELAAKSAKDDHELDHIIERQKQATVEMHQEEAKPEENQTIFDILLNMGASTSLSSSPPDNSKRSSASHHQTTSRSNGSYAIITSGPLQLSSSNNSPSATSPLKTPTGSNSDIPFDKFRYSPKLTNYTGEPQKTAQELKAIQDLHSTVQANVRALGSRALNTAEIARQCKRLMVAYNIGQRLFAKYVMNQVVKSQGSLSELLSKPRHWSKLTDKGREAFRRIYAWLSDDRCIELLCSLSPRRIWPSDTKIEHPKPESLWEGSGSMPPEEPPPEIIPKKVASAREDQYRLAGTNQAANSGQTRSSRWRHDDIPKEKIMSIFQTELAKLKEQESNLEKAISSRTVGNGSNENANELNGGKEGSIERAVGSQSRSGSNDPSDKTSTMNKAHLLMSNRMKIGLTPITQEQFEKFAHLDTEDIVKQVKEFLSINSISQRQFGEHVLGLSQGSVSDLLARPKQWSMLTQKGREPFIRMKLFMMEVASNGGKKSDESINSTKSLRDLLHNIDEHFDLQQFHQAEAMKVKREVSDDEPISMLERQAEMYPDINIDDPNYTINLTQRIKDRLQMHGISLKLFGEAVLGTSLAGATELLQRPRPWSALSLKAKEPYEKMAVWLEDLESQFELSEKARAESGPITSINTNGKRALQADPNYEHPSVPKKVQRTVITDQQKEALRFVFQHEPHPSSKTTELLAQKLNLGVRTVNNWFHNHRTRLKTNVNKDGSGSVPPSPTISNNWQQDLANMLDSAGMFNFSETLPTMVPVSLPSLFSNFDGEGNNDEDSSSSLLQHPASDDVTTANVDVSSFKNQLTTKSTSNGHKAGGSSSLLDRAVEKMRLLAEAKMSDA